MSIIQLVGLDRGIFDFGTLNSAGSGVGDFGFKSTAPTPFGSLTNQTIAPGLTIQEIYDSNVGIAFVIKITGFSSDPGQGYFKQIVIDGLGTRLASTATGYSFTGGTTATWSWAGSQLGFALATPYTGYFLL